MVLDSKNLIKVVLGILQSALFELENGKISSKEDEVLAHRENALRLCRSGILLVQDRLPKEGQGEEIEPHLHKHETSAGLPFEADAAHEIVPEWFPDAFFGFPNEDSANRDLEISKIMQVFLTQFEKVRIEAVEQANEALPKRLGNYNDANQFSFGNGSYVKQIWIPSYDKNIDLIEILLPWIPNCKGIKFNHPPHGSDFIPTIQPSLITFAMKYFSNFERFSVEDVDKDGWPLLIDSLIHHGQNIRHLSIEACSEKDSFTSKTGMSEVFPFLPRLESLRLDGLPIGAKIFRWGGDYDIAAMAHVCTNLNTISLDFCDLSTQTITTLWNMCPNLKFIGLAGLQMGNNEVNQNTFQMRPNLKTLRFVDCQVSDELLRLALPNCPNLKMLRIVYEYPASFTNGWNPDSALSDDFLKSVARSCKNLDVLAISKTSIMTSDGFKEILKSCPIRVIDFHK